MAGFEISEALRTQAAEVLDAAIGKSLKLATAESCTGGLVAALLTEIAGSSAAVERGFVTYSNEAKTEMLGVPASLIAEHGAVSEAVATAMAEGAVSYSHADLAVAITGIAGPGGSDFKPEGRVCFAVSGHAAETVEFGALGRSRVRAEAAHHALGLVLRTIRDWRS